MIGPVPTQADIAAATDPKIAHQGRKLTATWTAWLSQLRTTVAPIGGNGSTAQRPTSGLYVGMHYMDLTLGYNITVRSLNPTVWVNGAGTPV